MTRLLSILCLVLLAPACRAPQTPPRIDGGFHRHDRHAVSDSSDSLCQALAELLRSSGRASEVAVPRDADAAKIGSEELARVAAVTRD